MCPFLYDRLNTQLKGYADMKFEDYNVADLLLSLEAELAKGLNEIRHAQGDLEKAESRYVFALALIHYLKRKV